MDCPAAKRNLWAELFLLPHWTGCVANIEPAAVFFPQESASNATPPPSISPFFSSVNHGQHHGFLGRVGLSRQHWRSTKNWKYSRQEIICNVEGGSTTRSKRRTYSRQTWSPPLGSTKLSPPLKRPKIEELQIKILSRKGGKIAFLKNLSRL